MSRRARFASADAFHRTAELLEAGDQPRPRVLEHTLAVQEAHRGLSGAEHARQGMLRCERFPLHMACTNDLPQAATTTRSGEAF